MRRVASIVLLAAVGASALGGCTRIRQSQGYIVDESLISAIQPGVDNRDSVQKTLGRPTFTSQFDAGEWYYVSRNTGQLAFAAPKVMTQSTLIVSFDKKGTVTKVERRGMEKIASINPNSDKTPTLGRDTGLLEDLFGNIGTFGSTGAGDGPAGRDGPR